MQILKLHGARSRLTTTSHEGALDFDVAHENTRSSRNSWILHKTAKSFLSQLSLDFTCIIFCHIYSPTRYVYVHYFWILPISFFVISIHLRVTYVHVTPPANIYTTQFTLNEPQFNPATNINKLREKQSPHGHRDYPVASFLPASLSLLSRDPRRIVAPLHAR